MTSDTIREALDLVVSEVTAAGARPGEWVIQGSTVMYLHGIRRVVGDIDIFVSRPTWDALIERGWDCVQAADDYIHCDDPPIARLYIPEHELHVDAWYEWDKRHNFERDIVSDGIASMELVQGYPCMSLQLLMSWKKWLGGVGAHPKHAADAASISSYLQCKVAA